jgi:hypothetical protein
MMGKLVKWQLKRMVKEMTQEIKKEKNPKRKKVLGVAKQWYQQQLKKVT